MTIFLDPSETSSNSKFPDNVQFVLSPGLEAKFGCDFVISPLPIKPVLDPEKSIALGSYFVQRKTGWDILSFDNLKRSISRMKKANIPQKQCVLLLIGDYQRSQIDSSLVIDNQQGSSSVSYRVFSELKALWSERGGIVDIIPSNDCLSDWIEGRLLALKNVEKGGKVIYPEKQDAVALEPGGFQLVEEIASDDIRSLLCRGLPGFGPQLSQNVYDVLENDQFMKIDGGNYTLYDALWILTTLDQKGRPMVKIPGIGPGTVKKIRKALFGEVSNDWSLSISREGTSGDSFQRYLSGWRDSLNEVAKQIGESMKKGKQINIKEILSNVASEASKNE